MRLIRILIILVLTLSSACTSVVRNPVPETDHLNVTVLDRDDLRQWGDRKRSKILSNLQGADDLEQNYGGIMHREHHYLVISGGGAEGAYGAGVLSAWTELGSRPEFAIVTGVSTGALTAPFAFLGGEYDKILRQVYTTLDTEQVFNTRSLWSLVGGDSVVDTSPLSRLIEDYVGDELIEALAREHRRGRILLIGTTNLDAGRPTIWNITRIAASGHPDAPDLVRKVLLASASIPGIFPPVYIEVETPDGRKYDEMHVDGGVSGQMFFYPSIVDWESIAEILDVKGVPKIHVIRNAFVYADYEVMKPRLLPITERTLYSLIRTQGSGDFYRIWTLAERDGLDLSVTWIPESAREQIGVEPSEVFDPDYMRALFNYGYRRTLQENTWKNFSEFLDATEAAELPDTN